jgi:hypothetical protein
MKVYRFLGVILFGTLVCSGTVGHSVAMPAAKDVGVATNDSIIDVRAGRGGGGGGGRGGAARAGGGHANVARAGSVSRTNVNASRRTNVNVNRRTNVNVNRNVNVVGRRPVRGWVARPYYGTIVGGVALGTMIAVTAGAVPTAPGPNMCWFWADSAQVNGYWDYCVAP